jgi:PAS domain S-box-containing protein
VKKTKKENGNLLQYLENLLDQRTKNLHSLAEELNLLIESIPVIPYECLAGRITGTTYIHKSVKKITGFSPKEFIADTDFWFVRIHPGDTDRILGELTKLKAGDMIKLEYRWQIADGSYKWFSDHVRQYYDKNGDPVYIRGYWQEITEQKAQGKKG